MSAPLLLVVVTLAGGLGAVLRLLLDHLVRRLAGDSFPWGILLVNVLGSFALGLVTGFALAGAQGGGADAADGAALLVAVAGTGLLGGFTTFSTVSVDALRLLLARRVVAGLGNAFGTLVLGAGAAALGLWIALALTGALTGAA